MGKVTLCLLERQRGDAARPGGPGAPDLSRLKSTRYLLLGLFASAGA